MIPTYQTDAALAERPPSMAEVREDDAIEGCSIDQGDVHNSG
jgi:hypothetical protein